MSTLIYLSVSFSNKTLGHSNLTITRALFSALLIICISYYMLLSFSRSLEKLYGQQNLTHNLLHSFHYVFRFLFFPRAIVYILSLCDSLSLLLSRELSLTKRLVTLSSTLSTASPLSVLFNLYLLTYFFSLSKIVFHFMFYNVQIVKHGHS